MINVLLIGRNGQLAGELAKNAVEFGFNVLSYSRRDLDIRDPRRIAKVLTETNPDIVINAAAYNLVVQSEEEPLKAMDLNFLAVKNLSSLCKSRDITFVTFSTDYVFDGNKGSLYAEDDDPNPLQMYGMSKLAGEYVALSVYPAKTFIIRTSGIYGGLTGSPDKGNFVLNIIKEATGKKELEVNSGQIVSPTSAGDLARATWQLLRLQVDPGIYHIVNEGYCSWYEFAEELIKLAGLSTEIKPIDRSDNAGEVRRPKFSALGNIKAKQLGIVLPPWREALNSYIIWINE